MSKWSNFIWYAGTIAIFFLIQNCAVVAPYTIDKESAKHPATQVFIAYIKAVENHDNFDELLDFYSDADKKRIKTAMGWQYFAYSASFRALKNSECLTIKTKATSANRAQIDCLGEITLNPMFIASTKEQLHLRVNMVMHQNEWFVSRSGYVNTQENGSRRALNRIGITFQSVFE